MAARYRVVDEVVLFGGPVAAVVDVLPGGAVVVVVGLVVVVVAAGCVVGVSDVLGDGRERLDDDGMRTLGEAVGRAGAAGLLLLGV